jgi:hypothetical protein
MIVYRLGLRTAVGFTFETRCGSLRTREANETGELDRRVASLEVTQRKRP